MQASNQRWHLIGSKICGDGSKLVKVRLVEFRETQSLILATEIHSMLDHRRLAKLVKERYGLWI